MLCQAQATPETDPEPAFRLKEPWDFCDEFFLGISGIKGCWAWGVKDFFAFGGCWVLALGAKGCWHSRNPPNPVPFALLLLPKPKIANLQNPKWLGVKEVNPIKPGHLTLNRRSPKG